ncbi:MAG: GTP-binding protein [archaeon]
MQKLTINTSLDKGFNHMAKVSARQKKQEKINELEAELSKTKYNKRTQHSVGLLKAKIARLKDVEVKASGKKSATDGYNVRKTGDGTIILVGFPSVGKSTLLNAITNAESPVGAYDFTTLSVIPGLLEHKHAKIQVLDVPGIVAGAAVGTGRGKEVLACAVNADLVLMLIDVFNIKHLDVIKKEIYDTRIRLNQEKPFVKITKTSKGGLIVGATVKLTKINKQTVKAIMNEFRIFNADVVLRSDINADQLIDAIEDNRRYIPGILVLNKIDLIGEKKLEKLKKEFKPDLCISANKKEGIQKLKDLIFERMQYIRIYCKEIGKDADMLEPLIMFENATLHDMCSKLHKDFVTKFKFARVWGKSVKYDGQKVLKLKHILKDQDIVELHID